MARHGDPQDLAPTITLLRALRGWSKKELAVASGIDKSQISRYELGREAPTRKTLERIATAADVPACLLEPMTSFIRRLREAATGLKPSTLEAEGPTEPTPEARKRVADLFDRAASQGRAELKLLTAAQRRDRSISLIDEEGRSRAEFLWKNLEPRSTLERRVLVAGATEFQDPCLCLRLCDESERAAASDAVLARELAELALLVAEKVPGTVASRSRLQGYAWAFIGNARRVENDLRAAEEAFLRVKKLWKTRGAVADLRDLDEARVLDMEASLRRTQHRYAEAMRLHDEALAVGSPEQASYIHINKALTFEKSGEFERALNSLADASRLIDKDKAPRQACALRFNQAVIQLHLDRLAEAEPLLAEARELAIQLGNQLDLVRVRWLEGRVFAEQGCQKEALAAFEQVRREFSARGMVYDCALVSLELAALYHKQERTTEVKALVEQMVAVFRALGAHRETLAALRLCRGTD